MRLLGYFIGVVVVLFLLSILTSPITWGRTSWFGSEDDQ
jgi:hypothetical protein